MIDRADDYHWATVGEGSGRYLWLLHREATPGEVEVRALYQRATELGYDMTQARRTAQP